MLDLSMAIPDLGENDSASPSDLAETDLTNIDLATAPDMVSLAMTYPASAQWTSSGGGSCSGSNGSELNLSVGGGIVVGDVFASGGAQMSYTYFSSDTQ